MKNLQKILDVFSNYYPQLKTVKITMIDYDYVYVAKCKAKYTGNHYIKKKNKLRDVVPTEIILTSAATKKKEGHKQGPNLYGLVGRTAGTSDNFSYSKANKESGVVWSRDSLFEYLKAPKKFIPGTKMVFAGLKKPKDRDNLIEFLDQHHDV